MLSLLSVQKHRTVCRSQFVRFNQLWLLNVISKLTYSAMPILSLIWSHKLFPFSLFIFIAIYSLWVFFYIARHRWSIHLVGGATYTFLNFNSIVLYFTPDTYSSYFISGFSIEYIGLYSTYYTRARLLERIARNTEQDFSSNSSWYMI